MRKASLTAALLLVAVVLAAGAAVSAVSAASVQNAYAQEVRGTYVVRIPPGAAEQDQPHYEPASIAIPEGTTIAWFNDDTDQPHTVTSGGSPDEAGAGGIFDSGVMSTGSFFQQTFDEAGEFQYHCEIHPWATGSVSVSGAFEEGDNFRIGYGAGTVFDFTEQERSLLVIEPTSVEVPEDEPVTYQLTILKDGQEAFSEEFRTLGGKLYVELVPTDGPTQVTGPDISDPVIGAYHVQGRFLKDNAAYTIRTEITQIFDRPPEEPLVDDFGVQIVPEFPLGILLPVAAGIGATIFAGRRVLRK